MRQLRGKPMTVRSAECHGCGRPLAVVTESEYRTPYRKIAYCSEACRDDRRERAKRERAALDRKVCEACGEPFEPTRSDAKTCSPACRQRLYRLRKASA